MTILASVNCQRVGKMTIDHTQNNIVVTIEVTTYPGAGGVILSTKTESMQPTRFFIPVEQAIIIAEAIKMYALEAKK